MSWDPRTRASSNNTITASMHDHQPTLSEADIRRKSPAVARTEDADVVAARRDPERIKKPVVVVRRAVTLVHGDVEPVRPVDQVQMVDGERHFGLAAQLIGLHLLQLCIGSEAADVVSVEQADAKHKITGRL